MLSRRWFLRSAAIAPVSGIAVASAAIAAPVESERPYEFGKDPYVRGMILANMRLKGAGLEPIGGDDAVASFSNDWPGWAEFDGRVFK